MIERLATFDTRRGSAEAWVLTMARSLVIDHHRRARKVVPLSQGPSLADTTFQALELVLAGENERRLHALVLQAAPADRELLTLRYGDDLCHGEIAAILEIEEATVRKRLSRIVGRLREAMRDQTTRSPGEEVDCAAQ
jgi:RNA polymerase sigma-70 factor (ECF subfamily)